MINKAIKKEHILKAIKKVIEEGVPSNRKSTKFVLEYEGKHYPPKYILSLASKIANNKELSPSEFSGGNESNSFLSNLNFKIINTSNTKIDLPMKKSNSQINICTAIIGGSKTFNKWDKTSIDDKEKLLNEILKNINPQSNILILPAGYFQVDHNIINQTTNEIVSRITNELSQKNLDTIVCLGIDGLKHNLKIDQLGLAISKTGLIAKARKFHHMDNSINLAKNAFSEEGQKSRFFTINNVNFYLAVCYDLYGINHNKLPKSKAPDKIIGMIHGFDLSDKGSAVDFARKAMAGASKQWGSNCYSSAFFAENVSFENWPSGVNWKHDNDSVTSKKYEDIKIDDNYRKNFDSEFSISLRYFEK